MAVERSFLFAYLENQRANAYDQNTNLDQIGICHHKQHLLFRKCRPPAASLAAPRPVGAFLFYRRNFALSTESRPVGRLLLYAEKGTLLFLELLVGDDALFLQSVELFNLCVNITRSLLAFELLLLRMGHFILLTDIIQNCGDLPQLLFCADINV